MANIARAFELTSFISRLVSRDGRMRAGSSSASSPVIAGLIIAVLWFVATSGAQSRETVASHAWSASPSGHGVPAIHAIASYCIDGDVHSQRRSAPSVDVSLAERALLVVAMRQTMTPSGSDVVGRFASLVARGYDATAPPRALS